MAARKRWSLVFGGVGLLAMVAGLADPLEGFPLVLAGGALAVVSTRLAAASYFRAMAWGLCLAVVGCAVLVALSSIGGIGGSSGRSMAWGLTVIPYPIGALTLLIGSIFSLRQQVRSVRG